MADERHGPRDEYGADGTYQFFGMPSATTGAAIKQGWGDDGDDSPNADFNSTGYVDGGNYAVAILTDGRRPPTARRSATWSPPRPRR